MWKASFLFFAILVGCIKYVEIPDKQPSGGLETLQLVYNLENGYVPSRIFSGPSDYPPEKFHVYAIVAFPANGFAKERERHLLHCKAYIASLNNSFRLSRELHKQLVTVWPLNSNNTAYFLNNKTIELDSICEIAVSEYGLSSAQLALRQARMRDSSVKGVGPFLLAWSPAARKGQKDSDMLVMDLSGVNSYDSALKRYVMWAEEIENDPSTWESGWDYDKILANIANSLNQRGREWFRIIQGDD